MNPIAREASKLPLLLSDFFRHLHTQQKRKLVVFLCGQQEGERYFDLRHNIGDFINSKMGCKAFLGEQIEELRINTTPSQNHLSIEVAKAKESKLVVIFLESPGTISELTAFALDEKINPKLLVFNSEQYRDCKSFINLGPLRLLRPDQIVYYDSPNHQKLRAVVAQLDYEIARCWFNTYYSNPGKTLGDKKLEFEDYITLFLIYVTYPISPRNLKLLLAELTLQKTYKNVRKTLGALKLVANDNKKMLYPCVPLGKLTYPKGLIADISKMRLRLLSKKNLLETKNT